MKKIAPVEKCTGPKELLDYFIQLFGQFPYHSILTKWQRDQLYSLFENLPLDQAIRISDYSRGFACRFKIYPVPILLMCLLLSFLLW